jgi:hypothetical protein
MKRLRQIFKLTLLLSVPLSIFLVYKLKVSNIKNNLLFSTAHIVKLHFGFKGNYSYTIQFKDQNGNIVSDKRPLCFGADSTIANKYFLVAYNSKFPHEYEMLIKESDYKKYDLQYPDSLKWVDKYLNE